MLTFAAEVVALGETLERLIMSEQIKFCVDCAFYNEQVSALLKPEDKRKFAKCSRPDTKRELDGLVFISSELHEKGVWESYSFCTTERGSSNLCGPSAQFFQPKPPAPAPASEPPADA